MRVSIFFFLLINNVRPSSRISWQGRLTRLNLPLIPPLLSTYTNWLPKTSVDKRQEDDQGLQIDTCLPSAEAELAQFSAKKGERAHHWHPRDVFYARLRLGDQGKLFPFFLFQKKKEEEVSIIGPEWIVYLSTAYGKRPSRSIEHEITTLLEISLFLPFLFSTCCCCCNRDRKTFSRPMLSRQV